MMTVGSDWTLISQPLKGSMLATLTWYVRIVPAGWSPTVAGLTYKRAPAALTGCTTMETDRTDSNETERSTMTRILFRRATAGTRTVSPGCKRAGMKGFFKNLSLSYLTLFRNPCCVRQRAL